MSGASGGSIVAAIVCTRKNSDIGAFLESERLANIDRDPEQKRLAPEEVRDRLADLIPDLTFQEAYEVSGRHLNVQVAPAAKPPNGRLLNALTAPNWLIHNAVLAPCGVPAPFPPDWLKALPPTTQAARP